MNSRTRLAHTLRKKWTRIRDESAWAGNSRKNLAMAQQSALVLIATFPAAVLVTLQPSESNQIWFWSGLSLLVAGVVLVATARDGELERWRELIVPTLDIVAIGMLRIATWPDGTQLASLVLAPALWLVMRFRVRGVAIAFAMITVATSVPAIALTGDVALATATRFLLLPFTFLLIATMALTLYANLSKSHFSLQRTHQRLSKVTKDSEQQRRLFSAVYSNLNVGVLVMDADGNDIMANDAQERLHRLVSPPGNVDRTEAGHLIFDASGKQIPAEYRPARRVIRGETFDGVLIHVGPPGPHQLVYSVTSRLVQTGDGDVEARILVFDDVTERFRSGQAREQVIATVSHELRTPLTSILGYTDLAMDELSAASEGDLDGVKDYLDVVQRNAEALLARVEDLLLHQQATSGRLSLDIRPADVVELVGRSIESLRGLAEERSVEVRFTRQEPLEMKVDARRLSQVIDNLLSNALKYTEPGGNVTLSVEENQDGVHLSVADTGTGMTTTEVEELFTPFYRTQAALHSAVGGAGLGLLVSRGIAEAHGGTLTVWSEFGTGSTFHLRLPKHGPETLDDHSGTSTDDDR